MPNTNHPRLLSFALDDWSVLGGRVELDLTNGVIVLVGRNGVGKSAILEGLEVISSFAIGRFRRIRQNDEDSFPKVLEVSILTPTNRILHYRYEFLTLLPSNDTEDIDEADSSEEGLFSWNEQCKYSDTQEELLWTTESGITKLNFEEDKSNTVILGSTSSLGRARLSKNDLVRLPIEMEWVHSVLRGIRILGKIPARPTSRRRPSFLTVSSRGVRGGGLLGGLADSLTRKILRLIEIDELDELESLCQRVDLGRRITVQKFVLSRDSAVESSSPEEEYLSSVLLDNINVGLLSDGTLRVLSILVEIIASSYGSTTIIEEPEIQIHPGMLSKLLGEIESYTFGENLIVSTHSPQVVSWTRPENINFVYKRDNKTLIRKLAEQEIQKVIEYLCEEGDLGEWVYSGILDE